VKIVTSLSFRGQCREALEFYAKVLGGKITAAMPYGDAPPGMPITDEKYKTWLMHCWLEVGDQALMGADMDVDWARNIDKPKNGFDVTLHTHDKAEAKRWSWASTRTARLRPIRSLPSTGSILRLIPCGSVMGKSTV
jgi:PhnB protein